MNLRCIHLRVKAVGIRFPKVTKGAPPAPPAPPRGYYVVGQRYVGPGLLSFFLCLLASSVPGEGVDQGPLRRQIQVISPRIACWLSTPNSVTPHCSLNAPSPSTAGSLTEERGETPGPRACISLAHTTLGLRCPDTG